MPSGTLVDKLAGGIHQRSDGDRVHRVIDEVLHLCGGDPRITAGAEPHPRLAFVARALNDTDLGVMEVDMGVFDRVMKVNVRGFFLCTRAVLPALIARGGGSLLYTSSIAAYIGGSRRIAYAMSKTVILALMRHVATRHGPDGVRANAIAPGFIERPDQPEVFTPEIIAGAKSVQQLKDRIGRPDDIAAMSTLLMSDEGAFITGQSVAVDGGVTIRP